MIGNSNDEINYSQKLLLTNTQASKVRKDFSNGLSTNIKFSKHQLSKMIQSGVILIGISGITSGLDNIVKFPFKVLESYSKELNRVDTKKYKNKNNLYIDAELNIIGKKIKFVLRMTLTSNEMKDIIKVIKKIEKRY